MSTTIEHQLFGASDNDGRMLLMNSQIARKLSIGAAWNTLRIAFRISFTDTGSNLGGTPGLFFGLHSNPSAGMANGPLGNACSYFVGFKSVVSSWTRQTGANKGYYLASSSAYQHGHKIGATWTNEGTCWPCRSFSAAPAAARSVWLSEWTRGSGTVSVQNACMNVSVNQSVPDVAFVTVQNALNANTFATAIALIQGDDPTFLAGTTSSFTIDEATNGDLNSICIAWDLITSGLHLSDMSYSIIA